MNKQRIALIFSMFFALMLSAQAEMVRIVAWNVEWFPGRRPNANPKDIGRHIGMVRNALKKMNPDILILEEIRDLDAAKAALKYLPGFEIHVVSGFAERPQQIVIASRYKAKAAWWEYWRKYLGGPPRGFAFAALELPDDICLLVYGVHFKSNRGIDLFNKSLRLAAAEQLVCHTKAMVEQFKDCPQTAMVVTGDFNTNPDNARFKDDPTLPYLFGQGWFWPFQKVPPKHRITWRGDSNFESTQFDHFFTQNLGEPKAWVWENISYASDHLPIQIEIDTDKLKMQP